MRTFVLQLDPVPKGRPRYNTKTKKIFTPNKTRDFQNAVRKLVCRDLGEYFDYPMYEKGTPVIIDIDFLHKRTGRLTKKSAPEGLLWRDIGNDVDNLAKAVFDALNGILWDDDRQVVEARIRKLFTKANDDPKICIRVRKAGDPPQASCDFWNAEALDMLAGRKEGE